MKKKYIVKSNHEFQEIIGKGKKTVSQYFILYKVDANDVRFGISVGKKSRKCSN
jgi:ribonuclease P protein component